MTRRLSTSILDTIVNIPDNFRAVILQNDRPVNDINSTVLVSSVIIDNNVVDDIPLDFDPLLSIIVTFGLNLMIVITRPDGLHQITEVSCRWIIHSGTKQECYTQPEN